MKDALRLQLHQLRQPVSRRFIGVAAGILLVMTAAMAVGEFRHRAWVDPTVRVVGAVGFLLWCVSLTLVQWRIGRWRRERRTRG